MPVSLEIAVAPPSSVMMSGTVLMPPEYDNRMIYASPNTFFMLDAGFSVPQQRRVQTSHDFLDRLRAAGITQEQIAKVLGVSQPNAATLYKPGKNGKLRMLKWDEGAKLIKAFGDEIGEPSTEAAPSPISEELLSPIVEEIVAQAQSGKPGSSVRPLAEALSRYLRQLAASPAIHASPDALAAVAQAVSARSH